MSRVFKIGDKFRKTAGSEHAIGLEIQIKQELPGNMIEIEYLTSHIVHHPEGTLRKFSAEQLNNSLSSTFILIDDYESLKDNYKVTHKCEPIEMGFTVSKMVCPTCDKEFK